ncbi:MAG: hypothetical protein ACREEE_12140, partial [Dongiaceae bacterium]
SVLVRPVAVETVIGKDWANNALEVNRRGRLRGGLLPEKHRREEPAHDENKTKTAGHDSHETPKRKLGPPALDGFPDIRHQHSTQ